MDISNSHLPPKRHQTRNQKLTVPRLVSLEHRLLRAKDADGQPIALCDELLFFLDDPPPGVADRWQAGADLCASHAIKTSRMAVWRFYRAHILEWRREQMTPASTPGPDPQETAQMLNQARHLSAQRVLEALQNPQLAPGHLVGLIQNDNHRQQIQLGRDQFDDRVAVRSRREEAQRFRRMEEEIRDRLLRPGEKRIGPEYIRRARYHHA